MTENLYQSQLGVVAMVLYNMIKERDIMEFKHSEYFVKACLYKSMLQAVCFFTALHKAAYSPMFIVLLYPDALYAFQEKHPDITLEIFDRSDTEVMYTLRASEIIITTRETRGLHWRFKRLVPACA